MITQSAISSEKLKEKSSLQEQLFFELIESFARLKKNAEQSEHFLEEIKQLRVEIERALFEKEALRQEISVLLPLKDEIILLQNQITELKSSAKEIPPADDEEKSTLLRSLKKAESRIFEIEQELLTERETQWIEREKLKGEKEELIKKLAELANQLQRQYELSRTHKEDLLRLSTELKTARMEKEARGEEIAKLKAKIHELYLEKKEAKADNSDELKTRLEEALHLINTKK